MSSLHRPLVVVALALSTAACLAAAGCSPTEPTDAGTPAGDGGDTTIDAGTTTGEDAGFEPAGDAGFVALDGGFVESDGGLVAVDGGFVAADAGFVAADGGFAGVDAGGLPELTWYRDVLPIAQENCMSCHTTGGIGPFTMETYADVVDHVDDMATQVEARTMPPWMPADDCRPLLHTRRLTQDQIDTVVNWVAAGALAGDIADAPAAPAGLAGLPRVDETMVPAQSYTPIYSVNDDYHCVILDPANAGDVFVTGLDIAPGQRSMVHHVLLYSAVRTEAVAKDDDTPGTGWTCYGGPGVDGAGGYPATLGAWAPGSDAVVFPSGTGIKMLSTEVVVMQIHYNFETFGDDAPTAVIPADSTTVKLMYADAAVTEARLLPVANDAFSIPNDGQPYTATKSYPTAGAMIYGVLPHMHQLGTSIKVTASGTNGGCLVDIPEWDFHWQQSYFFETPMDTALGASATVACTWVNEGASNVTWGESTNDEMCLAYVYATSEFF